MKIFETPEMIIQEFAIEDVITTSGGGITGGDGDGNVGGGGNIMD